MLRYVAFAAALAVTVPALAADNTVLGAGTTAPADCPVLYSGVTIEEAADLMREAGYKAQIKTEEGQEPWIDSKASGLNFWVYFYRCDDANPSRCQQVQFQSSFSTNKEEQDKATQWAVDKVFGRSYNVEDSTYFEHPVDLEGGVTADNFMRNLELWDRLMGEFTKYIGW
jgi:hypothetical protein